MTEPNIRRIRIGPADLTLAVWGDGDPEIVMLHDGLGSIGQWRSVPGALASATGRTVAAYDRAGHGTSTPVPTGPWPADWLHQEAGVLDALLDTVAGSRPFVVGHSDGGSIALLQAATGSTPTSGLVALAAHTWVEDVCVASIAAMRAERSRFVDGLARHHRHPAELFEAWSGVWTGTDFAPWDIRPIVGSIEVPVLVVQGSDDEYATPDHATQTAAAIGAGATCRLVEGRGHLLHHQDPDGVVELIAAAVDAS